MFPHGYPVLGKEDAGQWHCIPLQQGLQVQTMDINLSQNLPLMFNRKEPHMEFGCLFSGKLQGNLKIDNSKEQYFSNDTSQLWCSLCSKAEGCVEYLSGSPLYSVSFILHGALLKNILSAKGIFSESLVPNNTPQKFNILGAITPEVKHTAGQIAKALNPSEPSQHLFLISKAYELLFQIFMDKESQDALVDIRERRYAVIRARKILDNNLASPPSLEVLARKSGLCVTYLTEAFKKTFGTTVFGYVRQQRLSHAKELITVHGLSASDAAWEVGYSSLSSFHRAFRLAYGTTPGSYRPAR